MSEWIERLVKERYKTYGTLAKRIGMTESGFSRAAKAGTFDVENCLRLADETGESAAVVFTMAGKAQIHDLIQRLYGQARGPQDADAVKAFDLISQLKSEPGRMARKGVLQVLDGLARQERQYTQETPPQSKPARARRG